MEYFLISLLFPICWSFIAKKLWPQHITLYETMAQVGIHGDHVSCSVSVC